MNAQPYFSHFAAAFWTAICLFAPAALCADTYSATATVEIRPGAAMNLSAVRRLLPKNDPSVTVNEVRDTRLFELAATSATPQQAADRANEIARNIQATLKKSGMEVIIWERAVPPKAPAKSQ